MKNLLVAFTVLLLFSCSNDTNNNNTPNQNIRLRIIKVEWSNINFSDFISETNYIYDENNLLLQEISDNGGKTTYEYLNGLTKRQYSGSDITYFTHTGNLITYSKVEYSNLNNADITYYKYNGDNKLIEQKEVLNGQNDITTVVYDKNGNAVKIIYDDGEFETIEYDNNPSNALAKFPKDEIKLRIGGCSVNNIIKISDKNGTVKTYSYTYNEYGYPKTITDDNGNVRTLTYETY